MLVDILQTEVTSDTITPSLLEMRRSVGQEKQEPRRNRSKTKRVQKDLARNISVFFLPVLIDSRIWRGSCNPGSLRRKRTCGLSGNGAHKHIFFVGREVLSDAEASVTSNPQVDCG